MISLQKLKEGVGVPPQGGGNSSLPRKRKWADNPAEELSIMPDFGSHLCRKASSSPEWQRCLDIKSGKFYYYNTRTMKRASGELPKPAAAAMSLELELNLPWQPAEEGFEKQEPETVGIFSKSSSSPGISSKGLSRSPSWLTFEGDEQQEMVTAVCKNCYMLVMMSKSSPSCPNCKYMHPSEPAAKDHFDTSLSLLC